MQHFYSLTTDFTPHLYPFLSPFLVLSLPPSCSLHLLFPSFLCVLLSLHLPFVQILFSNIEDILELHKEVLSAVETNLQPEPHPLHALGHVFLQFVSKLRVHQRHRDQQMLLCVYEILFMSPHTISNASPIKHQCSCGLNAHVPIWNSFALIQVDFSRHFEFPFPKWCFFFFFAYLPHLLFALHPKPCCSEPPPLPAPLPLWLNSGGSRE